MHSHIPGTRNFHGLGLSAELDAGTGQTLHCLTLWEALEGPVAAAAEAPGVQALLSLLALDGHASSLCVVFGAPLGDAESR